MDDWQAKLLKELNIDVLWEASNDSAGILCYLPLQPDPENEHPDLSGSSCAEEIIVTQKGTTELVTPFLPPPVTELAEDFTNV